MAETAGPAGATLVAHGLRHRMQGRVASPLRALWAYGFASGQAEFYNATRAQAACWFRRIIELFRSAGLEQALDGFVPPAWLLSEGARAELSLRLAIHPRDMHSPLCVRSIQRCLERLNGVSRASSY